MKEINIDFIDLDATLSRNNNIILRVLNKFYKVNISKNPDYIFYGDNGDSHLKYKCVKIYVAQENRMPNFRYCDYALTFLNIKDQRNLRLPFYVLASNHPSFHYDPKILVKQPYESENILEGRTKFCAFIASNSNVKRTKKRIDFFHKLSKYKKVDSGGSMLNNIGYNVEDKTSFLKEYKFSICFENRKYPGYTSEKVVDVMKARCMPIYWGNPEVDSDFNSKSFVNLHDFASDEDAIDYIIEMDRNDTRYLQKFKEPYFHSNTVSDWFSEDRLVPFLKTIFDSPKPQKNRSLFYFKDIIFNLQKNVEFLYGGHIRN